MGTSKERRRMIVITLEMVKKHKLSDADAVKRLVIDHGYSIKTAREYVRVARMVIDD